MRHFGFTTVIEKDEDGRFPAICRVEECLSRAYDMLAADSEADVEEVFAIQAEAILGSSDSPHR